MAVKIRLQEILAPAVTALTSGILLAQGAPPHLALPAGGAIGGAVKGFEFKQKATPERQRLTAALRKAMSHALASPDFELSQDTKDALLDLFTPENAASYLSTKDTAGQLEHSMRTILAYFDDCDLDTLPMESIPRNIVDLLEQAIQDDHGLAGLATYFNTKELLREIQILKQMLLDPPSNTPARPFYNLPRKNEDFAGREAILEAISNAFQNADIVTLTGLGGFGKSQIAFEYLNRHKEKYDAICVVNAESEISLDRDYREVALKTGLPSALSEPPDLVLRHVKTWLEQNNNYLFLYDNAEGLADQLRTFLPSGHLNGHILICTQDTRKPLGTHLEVDVFSPEDAITFLQERVPGTAEADAQTLATLLGRLPLALEHAAAYMAETQTSCVEYINLLPDNMLDTLDRGQPLSTTDYTKTVSTTWAISIARIQSEAARQLFNLCAYCAPDNIPLSLFTEGRDHLPQPLADTLAPNNTLAQNDILLELSRYSLLSFRSENSTRLLSLHRLLQTVVRQNLNPAPQWITSCLNMARHTFDYAHGTIQSRAAFKLSAPHILEIAHHSEAMFADDENAQEKTILTALLYHEVGVGFFHEGIYAKALELYEKALAIREVLLGREHLAAASSYNNIGHVYVQLGDDSNAREWFGRALAICETILGEEHPDTATVYNNLAGAYAHQGDYPSALMQYEKALAIREEVLGKKHPDTANTYNNIACICALQGDYLKALEWHEKALAICEEALDKEHPDTATTYNNIASVHEHLGNYSEASEWYEKALAICEKALGKEHPNTAIIYGNIAHIYFCHGDYFKTVELCVKSYRVLLPKLGAAHPNTIAVKNHMRLAYQAAALPEPFDDWLQTQLNP
ncbi:MAG: tetratricopeptide repeat protein [Oscillospiraceae bacterium]|nr:tetratricopeptide repeat protein [Oscillospiraceae bacterium]